MDPAGLGISESYRRLSSFEPHGDWVWILDDDDECVYSGLVADIKRISRDPHVDIIMVRMDHGEELGVLPDSEVWERIPALGHLGVSSFIVRQDIWMQHRGWFSTARYASDFDFIDAAFQGDPHPNVYWLDVVASRCQNGRNMGAAEYAIRPQGEMAVLR